MRTFTKITSLIMALIMLCMVACSRSNKDPEQTTVEIPLDTPYDTPYDTPLDIPYDTATDTPYDTPLNTLPGSPTETIPFTTAPENESVFVYNVIFALASIPPVLGALDSIESGYPTYAIIERGKTYNGIDSLENFHNVGFDVNNNLSNGFTDAEFNAMVAKVKELNGKTKNAFFVFYVQDGTALLGAAIAANAGLKRDQFHVYMCEDGTGAYHALYEKYIQNKTVNENTDEVYDNYVAKVKEAEAAFNKVMSKSDNKKGDFEYNIGLAYALAALGNFTYYLQNEEWIENTLRAAGDTRLLSAFKVKGNDAPDDYKLNLKYQKISEGIAKLTAEERTEYLTLMYGQYYEDTYRVLTRTERANEAAPERKLVFIGARHNGYPGFASNGAYGIGGLSENEKVPESYAELDSKYKTRLLFETENDYNVFLEQLNKSENYVGEISDGIKDRVKAAAFNIYIDYIYTLKFTYAIYGEKYDLVMKGHPREVIGSYEEWGNRYKVEGYVYDKLLDSLLLAFHSEDSTGKYIGIVPYGTAAENLAYLGADIAIAGLPSSTYNGFDTDVDVLFIIKDTDQDIAGTGYDEAASQVRVRYEAGNLLYTDDSGNKQITVFFNTGNVYKATSEIYKNGGNLALADSYKTRLEAWLSAVHGDAKDIDAQGFAVK